MFTTKNFFTLVGKHLLIAFVAGLIAVIVVFFLSLQITSISASVTKNRNLASALSERTALLSNLKHENDIIGTNDTIIRQAFVPSNNILGFVAILKSIALKNGVSQNYSFSNPTPIGGNMQFAIATISYQDTVSSNVPTFINYLKDFESLPYFTKIHSINVNSSQGDWLSGATVSFGAAVVAQEVQ